MHKMSYMKSDKQEIDAHFDDSIESVNIVEKISDNEDINNLKSLVLQNIRDDMAISDSVDLLKTPTVATSTTNTDICVLEVNESHYDFGASCPWLDGTSPGFTMLNASQLKSTNQCDQRSNLNDSTEIIQIHSENETPGTDSDVEVLLSEEVVESDWSAGPIEVLEFGAESDSLSIEHEKSENGNTDPLPSYSSSADFLRNQDSTELDISVEQFTRNSTRSYDHLSRSQLIETIHQLEAIVLRYRNAQQRLFEQVDALRLELSDNVIHTHRGNSD